MLLTSPELQASLDACSTPFCILDSEKRFVFANRVSLQTISQLLAAPIPLQLSDIVGRSVQTLGLTAEWVERLEKGCNLALTCRTSIQEEVLVQIDDDVQCQRWSFAPVLDADAPPQRVVVTCQKIEDKVQSRTEQLQTLLNFEGLLQRITEKVRDSLNETQILQAVVDELATQLTVLFCNIIFWERDQTGQEYYPIVGEYLKLAPELSGLVFPWDEIPGVEDQIMQGLPCQFCTVIQQGNLGWATILMCPMVDNNSTPLGDLLLLKHKEDHFSELEIQLVQHLADQCAIAIRQARLYKAVQSQVSDLEQLNYLKDDFLSTVSHELRSPMSNIKMATQMLETLLFPADCSLSQPTSTASSPIFSPSSFQKASRYFKILKDECQREIELINDLLDLSRLEAGVQPLNLSTIELHDWLLPIVEPFIERARSQHQTLTYTIAQPLPSITTDLISLERILTELLTNACKYTPYGHHIALDVWTEAPTLYLQVSNSGIGLPEAELNRIFDKFYRVPNHDPWKYGGTGLGLALVQKLLEQLSGQVTVTSEHNLITFLVKIPITLAI